MTVCIIYAVLLHTSVSKVQRGIIKMFNSLFFICSITKRTVKLQNGTD